MNRNTVGVALIGAGMIAKTHMSALSSLQPRVVLKTVVSRNPDRARPLAELYDGPAPNFTSDLASVCADPDIAMAIVATPPSVRSELIAALAKAGKHILLEKPVGRTLQDANDVVEICESAGVILGVLFQHRMRETSIAAAHHVASGKLGNLGVVEIEVPLWRDQSYYDELGRGTYARDGGGVMMTNAIHSIDLALSLTGPVTRVQAMTATSPLHQMEAEDFAIAGLNFANGAVGSFVASTAMFPHRTEVIRLHYENASLRLDKDSLEVSWRGADCDESGPVVSAGQKKPFSDARIQWHGAVIADFLDAMHDRREPIVTGRKALMSHRLIDAISKSSQSGHPVELA